MADSVLFDGVGDQIDLAQGGVGVFGPGTVLAIVKPVGTPTNPAHIFVTGGEWSLSVTNSFTLQLYTAGGVNVPSTGSDLLSDGTWALCGWTKPTGSVVPRWHYYAGGSWTHTDHATALANSGTPSGGSIIGNWSGQTEEWAGNILIAGYWNSALSDATIETLLNYPAWQAANPIEAWRLDAISGIQSFGTTGTADESSRVGTTLDTGDAPTWWSDTGSVQNVRPDADVTTTGWTTTPLYSKINDESDSTVISATAS